MGTKLYKASEDPHEYLFVCPGCGCGHGIRDKESRAAAIGGASWTFNGDLDKPTFTPSYLTGIPDPVTGEKFKRFRCHSYITNGHISFLTDCTHKLAGKTVELPDIDMDDRDDEGTHALFKGPEEIPDEKVIEEFFDPEDADETVEI